MKELTKTEGIELAGLCDDLKREDPKTMYFKEGRQWFVDFVEFIYDEGFKIIRE